ncbi:PepSY domain-containing protein, partial [Mycolicibacterium elephantis]
TRGSAWAVGRPPLRGAIRGLSPAAIVAVVVAAGVLGWFLPLFGLSLAAFVVVDLLIGAVKQRRAAAD